MNLLDLPVGLAALVVVGAAAGGIVWSRRQKTTQSPAGAPAASSARPGEGRADRTQKDVEGNAAELGGDLGMPNAPALPTATEGAPAHRVAAKAVIEQAQARAAGAPPAGDVPASEAETVPAPLSQFDGPAWAPTVPMADVAVEPQFADTMPAEMGFAPTGFADTMPAEIGFRQSHFADTQVAEVGELVEVAETADVAIDVPPSPAKGSSRRRST